MEKVTIVIVILLAVLTLLSLTLNGAMIYALTRVRDSALESLDDTQQALEQAQRGTFSYNFEIEDEVAITASVPIREQVTVPIETTIPISTVVSIPVRIGILGEYELDVPINTLVPIDMEVSTPISQTVDIETSVPIQMEVPVEIPVRDTPVADLLEDLADAIELLSRRLSAPFGSSSEVQAKE